MDGATLDGGTSSSNSIETTYILFELPYNALHADDEIKVSFATYVAKVWST